MQNSAHKVCIGHDLLTAGRVKGTFQRFLYFLITFIDDACMIFILLCNVWLFHTPQHEPKSQKNGRISQHYKASLTDSFDHHPVSLTPLSLSHTHSQTHSLYIYLYLSLTHTLPLTHTHTISMYLSISLTHTYTISCICLSLTHTYTHTIHISISLSHTLALSLSYPPPTHTHSQLAT